ncbi:MAG: DUF1572 family protein [Chitinophagaceae bacterium]
MEKAFITAITERFQSCKALGDKTLEKLSIEQLHFCPDSESNSISIIVQHLYGNMVSRFTNFLTEDGEKSWRKRDGEFMAMDIEKEDLLSFWETGWSFVFETIKTLEEANLLQKVTIRNEPLFVFDALLRQLAHYNYHIGQIVYLGKMQLQGNWTSLSIPKTKPI